MTLVILQGKPLRNNSKPWNILTPQNNCQMHIIMEEMEFRVKGKIRAYVYAKKHLSMVIMLSTLQVFKNIWYDTDNVISRKVST